MPKVSLQKCHLQAWAINHELHVWSDNFVVTMIAQSCELCYVNKLVQQKWELSLCWQKKSEDKWNSKFIKNLIAASFWYLDLYLAL